MNFGDDRDLCRNTVWLGGFSGRQPDACRPISESMGGPQWHEPHSSNALDVSCPGGSIVGRLPFNEVTILPQAQSVEMGLYRHCHLRGAWVE